MCEIPTKPPLTPHAQLILEAIGNGRILRVPHAGEPATLVHWFSDFGKDPHGIGRLTGPIGPLDAAAVAEALASGILFKLTRDRTGSRAGWRELGIDGSRADLYVFIQ